MRGKRAKALRKLTTGDPDKTGHWNRTGKGQTVFLHPDAERAQYHTLKNLYKNKDLKK